MLNDTICAVSTPHGKGGISVIRISGDKCRDIVSRIFKPINGSKLTFEPRKAVYGNITSSLSGETIDDGIMTFFAAPASFTGEDTAEISCHGGIVVTSMVLDAVLNAGAVHAEAGEFTKRAFLNGRMSLTKAEATADLLDARSESAAVLTGENSRGRLSKKLSEMANSLLFIASSLSAYIDYPDEDLEDMEDDELDSRIDGLLEECNKLIEGRKTGEAVTEGIPAVICGKPNVGKSSFFNYLIGEDRAIVTDIPGTTRDMIEYQVKAGKIMLKLLDTAGIRENTSDIVEKMGIDAVKKRLSSDSGSIIFVLFTHDSFDTEKNEFSKDDKAVLDSLPKDTEHIIIPVITKSDMNISTEILKSILTDSFGKCFVISSSTGSGMDELLGYVEGLYIKGDFDLRENVYLTSVRQVNNIRRAAEELTEAKKALYNGYKDMTGIFIEHALSAIMETDGRETGEAIIKDIFSRFCVGK